MSKRSKISDQSWVVYLSTYPPYEDGIATFTADLVSAQKKLFEGVMEVKVAAVDIWGMEQTDYPEEVRWKVKQNRRSDYVRLAEKLNKLSQVKCVNIQHEYGIFGGEWGEYILSFLETIKKPVTITLHTVLPDPPSKMLSLTGRILEQVQEVIVLTRHSQENLIKVYQIPAAKISIIPHGIHPVVFVDPKAAKAREGLEEKIILGTFGFLSPDKGIEYVIKSLPKVIKKHPGVEYWLMGRTHPLVQSRTGETYRQSLVDLVEKLSLTNHVKFFNKYMSVPEILKFLETTDIYICTSLNPDQTVSGTFSYALGSGRCVVSTAFAQAREYVKRGMGMLVDFRDPQAYARAIGKLLEKPSVMARMQRRVYDKTRNMVWGNVAVQYQNVYGKLVPEIAADKCLPPVDLQHLWRMTDEIGMVQFAKGSTPDLDSGYTIDDNARALIMCVKFYQDRKDRLVLKKISKYLEFIQFCQKPAGNFVNYINRHHEVEQQLNTWENLEDANARTLWGLGVVMGAEELPEAIRRRAEKIWKKWERSETQFEYPRAKAFRIKAIYEMIHNRPDLMTKYKSELVKEADALMQLYQKNSTSRWKWFENEVTYANGVLPEALLRCHQLTKRKRYLQVGLSALEFLVRSNFRCRVYISVGNEGWFAKNQTRKDFDQQPEEPMAMIEALTVAREVTGLKRYRDLAVDCFYWFLGNNLLCERMYNSKTGGCYDGLIKTGVNGNQGAESTLAYLLSRWQVEKNENN